MNRSWTIATIRGIPIRIHISLLVLVPLAAVTFSNQFQFYYGSIAGISGVEHGPTTLPPLVWGVILAFGLLVGILLHELAHCMVAISSGVRVESITLMMLGGVSRIEGEIARPMREVAMAAAGPLTSLAIGAVFYVGTKALPGLPTENTVAGMLFALVNVVLGVFNLLPAFPMDGGRILRAALTPTMGRLAATRRAALVGKILAVPLAILGILFNPLLVLIAVFIVLGATAETSMLENRVLLAGRRVGAFADPRIGDVLPETPVWRVAERFLEDNLVAVRVGDGVNGPGAGYITLGDLERVGKKGARLTAGDISRRDLPRVWASHDAAAVLQAAQARGKDAVLVFEDNGEPVGIVTGADLGRAASVASLLQDLAAPENRT